MMYTLVLPVQASIITLILQIKKKKIRVAKQDDLIFMHQLT